MTILSNKQHQDILLTALQSKQFLKLIVGASFTDAPQIQKLVLSYSKSGICCIDIACDANLIQQTSETLAQNNINNIALMTSISIDDDPHFRKILLERDLCIDCGACINSCPTNVFSMPETTLLTEVSKCYGCNRCVPICPTSALTLEPFFTQSQWVKALQHPSISAVEIHSNFVDPAMVPDFWNELGDLLVDKIISLCFRPQTHTIEKVFLFIEAFQKRSPYPLIIQIDGNPMSATHELLSSQPAINAAMNFYKHYQHSNLLPLFITLSGGINQHTPMLLKTLGQHPIQGVGIGTTAKQWIRPVADNVALAKQKANELIALFLAELRENREEKGYNTHERYKEGQLQ